MCDIISSHICNYTSTRALRLIYVRVMFFSCVPWLILCVPGLIRMCDVTHSYVCLDSYMCHDSFICVPCLICTCATIYLYGCHASFIRVLSLIHMCAMTHSCVPWPIHIVAMTHHDSSVRVPWLICVCAMTHLCVCHGSFVCVPWLICVCAMAHLCVCHESFVCVPWLICVCTMTHIYSNMTHSHFLGKTTLTGDSFTRVAWLIHTFDMTHSHMWHESFKCKRVISQIWRMHGIHMNEPWHTYSALPQSSCELLMQISNESCVTHMDG